MAKKNSKKTVPELRFRGFTDPWEQRQLGGMAQRVPRSNLNNECSRVLTASAEAGLIDQQEYFQKRIASHDLSHYYLLKRGDFAYNHSSSGSAALGIIKRLDAYDSGCLSTLYIVFHPKQGIDSDYLLHYFESSAWHGDVAGMVTEGARNHGLLNISPDTFFTARFSFPSLPEQRRIGDFFSILDNLIAAAERQETLLRQKKQAYLQLMFPREGETQPRLRFSGFSGDWEQRQSSELFVPVKENGHSDLPVLSATQSEGMVYRDDQSRDIKFKKDNLGSYKLVRAGDFVISLRSFQGGFELSDKTGIVSPAYTVFTHTGCSSQDNAYWKQYFKRKFFIESLKTVTFGIRDGKAISFSDFSSLKCIFPSLPEQRLIGQFFKTLDSLIVAAEERTKALKETKSAYLQRMFV